MKVDVENRIYNLAKQLCKNLPEAIPEGILYGYIKMTSMNADALKDYLKKGGVPDVEEAVKELTAAKETLEKRELDVELLKTGLQLVINKLSSNPADTESYSKVVDGYDESTSVTKLIDDALDNIPEEELAVFKQGSKLADVVAYTKTMAAAPASEAAPGGTVSEDGAEQPDADAGTEADNTGADEGKERTGEEEVEELYSDVLSGYIDNLKKIIPAFKKNGNKNLLWSQSLLVSIDEGFGLTTFMKAMVRAYKDEGLYTKPVIRDGVFKRKLRDIGDPDNRYADWNILIDDLRKITMYSINKSELIMVVDIDISEWINELGSARIKEYLTKINQLDPRLVFIFRIPYMEHTIVNSIRADLSDVINVSPLIVPSDGSEKMLKYMRKKAEGYGYTFSPECDDILEQGIVAEKNDGSFHGYNTLSKMVDAIIYDRICEEADSPEKENSKEITADELKRYLNVSVDERSADEQLSDMIGVKYIVDQIDELINQIKVQQQMAAKGMSLDRPTIHMIFTGSPGTGKTTIARIIAKKMKEEGILSKGNFYEIKGRDLCGRYIGETTPKTTALCRAAYGSVLFIDEAYELFRGGDNPRDYGREAITALIAEMENHRDDMCVIMAGYTDEMNKLMESNPGLKSRVRSTLEFKNYSRSELEEIFYTMVGDTFDYDDSFKDTVHEYFDNLDEEMLSDKTFSNGRFVRNLYENTWGIAALRMEFDEDGRLKLKSSDFTAAADKTDAKGTDEPKRRPMGFGAF